MESTHNLSSWDQDIIYQLDQGNPEFLEKWFRDNVDALFTFAYYRVGKDSEIAADVVQETFLDAIRLIHKYDPTRGNMLVWLTWLARNHIREALYERGRFKVINDFWLQIDEKFLRDFRNLDSQLPEDTIEREETADLVRITIAKIPDHYQRVLKGRYWESKSIEELAKSEGSTVGAIKSMLHRARQSFQAAFCAIGDVCSELQSSECEMIR